MGESKTTRQTSRYSSLDGLRGLAALVVVVTHCCLVSPQLANAVHTDGTGPMDVWVWWVTFTPLHLLWAGSEAVYVFFILSGFVLALPFVGASRPSWMAYYPKRLIRIYLPVWASLGAALLLTWVVPRRSNSELSSWVNEHDETPNLVLDALLLGGAGALNGPLWSLRYEMLFSLLLPLYIILIPPSRRLWFPAFLGLLLLVAVGNIFYSPLPVYMPMFGLGVLMASRREDLAKWGGKIPSSGWIALVAASVLLLCSRWLWPQLPVVISLAALGGTFLIFAFIAWRPAITLGSRPLIRWLGLRSFSLYLVHEPILLAITFAVHSTDVLHMTLLTLPLSLLAAELFFRLIEQPSQRLAATAGLMMNYRAHRKAKVS